MLNSSLKEWGVERFMKKKTGRFIKSTTHEAKAEHQSVNRKGKETQKLAKPPRKQSIKTQPSKDGRDRKDLW